MKPKENWFLWRSVLLSALLAASLLVSGCLVIPHPRNIATARGIERKKPKLERLKDGTTTKADVLGELGDFDTNASQARFVWARWQQVKVQTEWLVVVGGRGYSGGVAGGSIQSWIIKNVLAGFNDNVILAEHRICSEDDLIGCIEAMTAYTSQDEASTALLLPSWRGLGSPQDGRVIFEEDKVAFEHFRKPKQNFVLPLSAVGRLTAVHGASPEILRLSLHFKGKTKPMKPLNLEASPKETIQLVRLLQSRPGQAPGVDPRSLARRSG